MKYSVIILSIFLQITVSCVDEVSEKPVQLSNPADYNMKIIPENPITNQDIKLVICNDCTYNVLSGVKRNGNMIDIRKQFNSMMKWPCFPENDTINLGQLPVGTYTINYKLADLSIVAKDSIALSFSFGLTVSR